MTVDSAPVIRSTGGPVAAEDELSERVREWCQALGIPFTDISTEAAPAQEPT
jgi:hypothetical protein